MRSLSKLMLSQTTVRFVVFQRRSFLFSGHNYAERGDFIFVTRTKPRWSEYAWM